MKTLVIDNYDSFTYNLVELIEQVQGERPHVVRNQQLMKLNMEEYAQVVISPGPGVPGESGQLVEFVKQYLHQKPFFGICLGHQCLAEVIGGKLELMKQPVHGKSSKIRVQPTSALFQGLPELIEVGRYHSWLVSKDQLPDCLKVTSMSEEGEIMAYEHRDLPVFGVQFHPESILTSLGKTIVESFLNLNHDRIH